MSASMMGSEYGADDRIPDTVDLPVAIDPVSPMRSIPPCCCDDDCLSSLVGESPPVKCFLDLCLVDGDGFSILMFPLMKLMVVVER
jgi:hypothetical protein